MVCHPHQAVAMGLVSKYLLTLQAPQVQTGAGEMARWLGALADPAEELSESPVVHIRQLMSICISSSREFSTPFWTPWPPKRKCSSTHDVSEGLSGLQGQETNCLPNICWMIY